MTTKPAAKPAILIETERAQALASDPSSSVWVAANAGAGKTHVLKTRVLRLLLAGVEPGGILCLTYTKAAASEMASRVFADLAKWATAAPDDLATLLHGITGRTPSAAETAVARQLFARAIETPGGLKVETIHAFCEKLLQRFPLEAGVPPGFAILDDTAGAELMRDCIDEVLTLASRDPAGELGQALRTIVALAQGETFDELIRDALARRNWLPTAQMLSRRADIFEAWREIYARGFGLDPDATRDSITKAAVRVVDDVTISSAVTVLSAGTKTDQETASRLAGARAAKAERHRFDILCKAFLTEKLEARADKSFITKKTRAADPGLADHLCSARDRFASLCSDLDAIRAVDATMALLRIASEVAQRYRDGKAERAALDFDDLIERTRGLLSSSAQADWVLYKLDGGLEHILVDEAQDTSPAQWEVIHALANEFYAGRGARDGEAPRTVFAVGDEKQSIYSFQGAKPEMFADMGRRFRALARHSGLGFEAVPLTLSFRTVPPVLDAVDAVFADPRRTPGLTADAATVRHVALRAGHAGLVELWEPEPHDAPEEAHAFDPLEEASASAPVARLAARIADEIRHWLTSGERLVSQDRPIEAGDIMILVRRRRPFAPAMVAALKERGIPVAGADRMVLAEQLAVQDLMALLRVLALPEDDLSLAAALKSPLFGLDDDDLMRIAPGRRGSLYSALLAAGRSAARFTPAADQLKRWRALADQLPPYELLSLILDRDGMRRRLIARLGLEAADPIDELLSLALAYDDDAPPSLEGFITHVRTGGHEIKRDLEHGRNEVRVLTVHGSKGLEAPIVFLPDTCAAGGRAATLVPMPRLDVPAETAQACVWPPKGTRRLAPIADAAAVVAEGEAHERNRLLYVAMTRARDRLYIGGYEGKKGRAAGCWYDIIQESLADKLSRTDDRLGRPVFRLASEQTAKPEPRRTETASTAADEPPPAWAGTPAPDERRATVPLTPSKLAPLEIDDDGEPVDRIRPVSEQTAAERNADPPHPSPVRLAGDRRLLRGTLTHALLEHLPSLDPGTWAKAARGFVDTRGVELPPKVRKSIVDETLAVLRDPAFAPVFAAGSRAEVPIVAELSPPARDGAPVRVTGQIDRIAVVGETVLVVDYKTNRPPPTEVTAIPRAYLLQLAAYRLALSRIYDKNIVQCAILWTDGPRLMPVPDEMLDARRCGNVGAVTGSP